MQSAWAVILCKFKGATDEPFPIQYYRDLFTPVDTGSPWNMVRYFSDYSHGSLDLSGSQIGVWLGSPHHGVVAQDTTPIFAVLGEEMGHVYGLMHSRVDGSEADYLDPWDGMSA